MKGLSDKVAVVAGGGSGMGAATARRLASEGCKVVVGDLRPEGAKSVVGEIVDAGGVAVAQQFDLSDDASVKALVNCAVETYGGLDLLANVGGNVGRGSALEDDTDAVSIATEIWEATMHVNIRGYLFTARHAIPEMLKRGGGAIASVSSEAAAVQMPHMPAYSVSKAGVEALMRHISTKWGPQGIRANAVAPGAIHTPALDTWFEDRGLSLPPTYSPLGRGGQPEEIASVIAFLLSDESSLILGQVIAANGGHFMSPQ